MRVVLRTTDGWLRGDVPACRTFINMLLVRHSARHPESLRKGFPEGPQSHHRCPEIPQGIWISHDHIQGSVFAMVRQTADLALKWVPGVGTWKRRELEPT